MIRNVIRYIALLPFAAIALHSCLIENDMSYPKVDMAFTAFAVEGQESVDIDAQARTVSIVLSETADISHLTITDIAFSDKVRCTPYMDIGDEIDLSEPKKVTLSVYQDCEWTISATQPVDRYVRCTGQIGGAVIDVEGKKALVNISSAQNVYEVVFEDMKLEPEGAVFLGYLDSDNETVVEFDFPLTLDCTTSRTFVIEYKGTEIKWSVTVVRQDIEMAVTSVYPWCYSADLKGEFDGSGTPRIEYRADSDTEWTESDDAVTVSGTALSAKLSGLKEGTKYHVRFVKDGDEGTEAVFSTGTPDQIENMDFDDWYSVKQGLNNIWYPNLNEASGVWGTANPASGTFIGSLTVPEESFVAVSGEGKRAARLESKNAVIAFAAGNIFTGSFGRINGLGAILDWGIRFTARPSALKGYYAYKPVKIDKVKAPYENLENTMDKCQILVMLTDWPEPFTINTTDGIFVDQTQSNESIIAYGKMESDEDTGDEYREFTVELEYWRPEATPKYVVVVACSSYKGDYFTGGVGSVMYVDEFEFVYE